MNIMYLRKSRSDDASETVEEVLARHERQLQEFAQKTFGEPISQENIFREIVSGETIENRPEIKKVLSMIESPSVDGIVVIEPQRLSRGDLIDCGTIIRAFKYSRTKIYTPIKTYDLWNKFDERFFKDELLRGREFLEYTKEILERGRRASASEGNYVGSIPPYGYDKIRVTDKGRKFYTLIPNKKESEAVKMIFELYASGKMGTTKIANTLNGLGYRPKRSDYFTTQSVIEILRREVYTGKISFGIRRKQEYYENGIIKITRPRSNDYKLVDGKHEAIISDELFKKAQERRGKNPRVKAGRELKNPFAGLLYCKCGKAMSWATFGGEKPVLVCKEQSRCRSRSVRYCDLEEAIVDSLKKTIADFDIKIEKKEDISIDIHKKQIENVEAELAEMDTLQERLFSFLENGTYSEEVFVERNDKLAERRKCAIEKLTELNNISYESMDIKLKVVTMKQAIELLARKNIPAKEKNDLLKSFIDKIIYTTECEARHGNGFEVNIFHLDIFLL